MHTSYFDALLSAKLSIVRKLKIKSTNLKYSTPQCCCMKNILRNKAMTFLDKTNLIIQRKKGVSFHPSEKRPI